VVFCTNCGTQLQDGAKFCPSCGTAAGGAAPAPIPAVEKVGNIHKCPACGAEVPSMTATCPSCGHEFSDVRIADSIKEFFNRIVEMDSRPRSKRENTFKIKIALFFGLVVVLAAAGFFIYDFEGSLEMYQVIIGIATIVIVALILFLPRAHFTDEDNAKKTLIENFPIPNSKEDLIEFLILASSKVVPANGFSNAAVLQREWNKIWAIKCGQVYTKADIAFAGDEKSVSTVKNIREKTEKPIRQAKKQALLTAAAAAIAVITLGIAVFMNTSSAVVKLPDPKTWEPDKVELAGSFFKHFKVAGNGVTLTPNPDIPSGASGPQVILTMEVECVSPFAPELDKKLAETKKSKGWEEGDNCTYTLLDPHLNIDPFQSRDIQEDVISSMTDMKEGDTKAIRVVVYGVDFISSSSEREKKEAVIRLMEQSSLIIESAIEYQITNRTKTAKEGTSFDTWTTVVF
jgi:RNA polymerase subunit RPABC4/transcription elongation factor Spt4